MPRTCRVPQSPQRRCHCCNGAAAARWRGASMHAGGDFGDVRVCGYTTQDRHRPCASTHWSTQPCLRTAWTCWRSCCPTSPQTPHRKHLSPAPAKPSRNPCCPRPQRASHQAPHAAQLPRGSSGCRSWDSLTPHPRRHVACATSHHPPPCASRRHTASSGGAALLMAHKPTILECPSTSFLSLKKLPHAAPGTICALPRRGNHHRWSLLALPEPHSSQRRCTAPISSSMPCQAVPGTGRYTLQSMTNA